jgi:hypothetical protein
MMLDLVPDLVTSTVQAKSFHSESHQHTRRTDTLYMTWVIVVDYKASDIYSLHEQKIVTCY